MSRTRAQKRAAKLRNANKRADLFKAKGPGRVRRTFFGKARKGDKAKLAFTFSGDAIPVDEGREVETLKERSEAIAAWEREGCPTEGEA